MPSLEKVSHIAVIIAAGVFVGSKIYDRFLPRPIPTSVSVQMTSAKLMGKPLPLPESLGKGANGTITLFVSRNCHFCTESMGFYRRLAKSRPTSCDMRLIAVGRKEVENREDVRIYLTANDVTVDGSEVVDFRSLGLSGTPTVVLRDASGLVRGVWIGKLSGAQEDEVLSTVNSFCHS